MLDFRDWLSAFLNAVMYTHAGMRTQRRSIGPICTWRMRSRVSYVGVGEGGTPLFRTPATGPSHPSVTSMPLRGRKGACSQGLPACLCEVTY